MFLQWSCIVVCLFFTATHAALRQSSLKEGDGTTCVVRSYIVRSDVHLRYATTLLQVKMMNPNRRRHALNCRLRVMVPEAAFVSSLLIEIGDRVFHSVVTNREEGEVNEPQPEVTQDEELLDAFRVPRDSKLVQATVNLAPRQEATFYLTYEQLVTRRLGIYELILNIHPGQVVPELTAEVYLYESREFAVIRIPGLRSGHEIDPLELQSEFPLAKVRRPSRYEAHVSFSPTQGQQLQMANSKSWIRDPKSRVNSEGIAGQFVVQFEMIRPRDGEVTVHGGFFVHHFAPTAFTVLPKHVVFVLDLSSSMAGRKIQQLKTAMKAILDELRRGDYFSIIQFNSFKSVWSPHGKEKKKNKHHGGDRISRVVPVKPRYIAKAKKYISQMDAMGGTNIQRALVKALDVAHSATSLTPLSLVVVLTDGETTVGDSEPAKILQAVRAASRLNPNMTRQIPIHSLAFGVEADFPFLRRLSAENLGSARRIYDAEDAALQMHEVYAELSSPVLADVTFNYPDNVVDRSSLTQHRFAAAYLGSEHVVAGRLQEGVVLETTNDGGEGEMWGEVKGRGVTGTVATLHLPPPPIIPDTISPPLERVWAYLTLQQVLLGGASSPDARQEATRLALEYSFVTGTTTIAMRSENDEPLQDGIMSVRLPAHQEIGGETQGGRGGDDACSEGEYWFPLQQAFIPCGDKRTPSSRHRTNQESRETVEVRAAHQTTSLDQLKWLSDVRYGLRYLVLPKGRAGADQLFSLGLNETNYPHAPCLSPVGEPSHCRHLHFCPLQEFENDYQTFLRFFCPINDFAGVCCPDSIFTEADSVPYFK